MAWLRRARTPAERSLRRQFVTPEGVDLKLELAGAGERATAFLLNALIMLVILIAATTAIVFLGIGAGASADSALAIIWLLGFFGLRNG